MIVEHAEPVRFLLRQTDDGEPMGHLGGSSRPLSAADASWKPLETEIAVAQVCCTPCARVIVFVTVTVAPRHRAYA